MYSYLTNKILKQFSVWLLRGRNLNIFKMKLDHVMEVIWNVCVWRAPEYISGFTSLSLVLATCEIISKRKKILLGNILNACFSILHPQYDAIIIFLIKLDSAKEIIVFGFLLQWISKAEFLRRNLQIEQGLLQMFLTKWLLKLGLLVLWTHRVCLYLDFRSTPSMVTAGSFP